MTQLAEPIPEQIDGLPVPARFVHSLTIAAEPDGSLAATRITPAHPNRPPPQEVTAVIFDGGAHHYFHFIETMIWLLALTGRFLPQARLVRIVFAWPWDNPEQNHVQKHVLAALCPDAEIVDAGWRMPRTYADVLMIDRSWSQSTIHKFLQASLPFAGPFARWMSHMARAAVGSAAPSHTSPPRILYVRRPTPRCLVPEAETALLQLLAQHGAVTSCDFGAVPWSQQVRLAAAHHTLVGVHGNGLTNAVWMRPGSLVLEIFPDGVRHYDYQLFAELCGLRYFGFERDFVFPAFSRTGPPYGHDKPTQRPVRGINHANLSHVLALGHQ